MLSCDNYASRRELMDKKYNIFRKFLDQLWKEFGQNKKNQPKINQSALILSTRDNSQGPDLIREGMKETHEVIIREFYYRCRRN